MWIAVIFCNAFVSKCSVKIELFWLVWCQIFQIINTLILRLYTSQCVCVWVCVWGGGVLDLWNYTIMPRPKQHALACRSVILGEETSNIARCDGEKSDLWQCGGREMRTESCYAWLERSATLVVCVGWECCVCVHVCVCACVGG